MADIIYKVEVDLSAKGGLHIPLSDVHSKASSLDSVISKLGEGITGVADKIEHAVMGFAKLAGAAGIGLATYGVMKLNDSLEQTKLSMAAIFNAQGFTKDFPEAMGLASDQLAKMKQDVKTLPGDLGQLSDIMKTIATPAAQGGANPDAIRQLAGQGMLVGRILGVQQEVVSRELANLLSGRAGAHNILGLRMGLAGDTAKAFNEKDAAGRLADIQSRFQSYAPAVDAFSKSFIANWTTLVDNVKYVLLSPATSPLFESVKASIIKANDYLDEHRVQVERLVEIVGDRLAAAWGKGEAILKRYGPLVGDFVEKIVRMDPAELESKVGQLAGGILAAKMAGGALGMVGHAGLLAKMGGGGEAGVSGLVAALPALGEAALAAAPLLLAVGGAIDVLTDKTNKYNSTALIYAEDIASKLGAAFEKLSQHTGGFRDFLDRLGVGMLQSLDRATMDLNKFIDALDLLPMALQHLATNAPDKQAWATFLTSKDTPDPIGQHDYDLPPFLKATVSEMGKELRKVTPGAGGGGGGTHIQKVEIVVNSNQDPIAIGRVVESRLSELARHPRVSRYAPNYSRAR